MVDPINNSTNDFDDSSDDNGLERSTGTIDTLQAAEQLEMLVQEHHKDERERQEMAEYGDLERSGSIGSIRSRKSSSSGSDRDYNLEDSTEDSTQDMKGRHSAYTVRHQEEGAKSGDQLQQEQAGTYQLSPAPPNQTATHRLTHARAVSAADRSRPALTRNTSSRLGLQLSLGQLSPRPESSSSSGLWSWPRSRPVSRSSTLTLHSVYEFEPESNQQQDGSTLRRGNGQTSEGTDRDDSEGVD